MEYLIGKDGISDSAIIDLSRDWNIVDQECFSWKLVWKLDNTLNFGNDSEEKFSGGKDGSVIARYRKFDTLYSTKSIEIYDYKGNLLYNYEIRMDTNDLFFHVTNDDKLIVLTTTGYLLTFFAGREVSRCKIIDQDVEVLDADFWDEGLVFLTKDKQLYYAPSFENAKHFQDFNSTSQLKDKMKVIPPKVDKPLTVLITDGGGKVYVIKETGIKVVTIEENPGFIANFSINTNYSLIAFLCNSNGSVVIVVTDIDLQILVKAYPDRRDMIRQISWCGIECPIITYEDSVNVILSNGSIWEMKNENFSFSGNSWVFQSLKYSLVFSSGNLYKIDCISDDFFAAFRKDNDKAVSMDLVKAFLNRSSERALTMKKEGKLMKAMKICQKTSLETDSPQVQQLLMYSANFARTYLDLRDDYESFSDDIKKMRLSNSFSTELNVILLPYYLYDTVSQQDLLYRICNRKRFSLALKIADYLLYDKRFIITEWCLSMAYENQNDEIALKFISSKYQSNSELFEINSIATALSKECRLNLAKNVAELDPAKMNVVPFFISCEMWEEALNAAKNSYDSTLFIDTFNKAIDNKKEEEVIEIVKKDQFMYRNIAKLILQKDYESTNDEDEDRPSIISDRLKAYKRVIGENYQSFTTQNMNDFIGKLKISKNKFHINHEEDPNDVKTNNQILEQMILNINYDDVNNILEFLKSLASSSGMLKFKYTPEKYYITIASVLARHKKWQQFLMLADNNFSKYHYHYVLIAKYNFDYDHALEFIHSVNDPKKQKLLEEFLSIERPTDQYNELLRKDINFLYFQKEIKFKF